MKVSRAGKDELEAKLDEYIKSMEANAASLLNIPMPEADEYMFSLFETTGNRLTYEGIYFHRRRYLAVYGGLAIFQEAPRYLAKLEEVIRGICEEESWALPAHVNRAGDPDWRRTVDLFAAETGQALAQILALAGKKLQPKIRELARKNVMERVLLPFMESQPPYLPWERGNNNWNAVCAGSIGCAGIYLFAGDSELDTNELLLAQRSGRSQCNRQSDARSSCGNSTAEFCCNDELESACESAPELEKLIDRVLLSLEYYIDGFADDGTCIEGLGYFSYGFCYYVGFAQLLYQYTQGEIDLLSQDKVRRIALFQQKCYFPSGCTLSFSDGSRDDKYRLGLTCALAMRYPEMEIPPVSCAGGFETDSCYRFMAIYQDVVWTRRYLDNLEEFDKARANEDMKTTGGSKTSESQPYIVLPDAQWSIVRGASGGGMACRGGTNGESHNHNDIGSFLYLLGDEMLLTDLGAGEYTRQYFSEKERYQILCNRSLGHNVPLIDGKEQKAGAQYCCDSFWSDGNGKTVIHFASAYGNEVVKDLTRTLEYDAETERLIVEDVLETAAALREMRQISDGMDDIVMRMRENLVTEFPPVIEENRILIYGERYGCQITVEGLEGQIEVEEKKHSDHRGKQVPVYCISWESSISEARGRHSRFWVEPIVISVSQRGQRHDRHAIRSLIGCI